MPSKRTRLPRMAAAGLTETHWAWLRGEELDLAAHESLIWYALDDDRDWPPHIPPGPRPWQASGMSGREAWELRGEEIVAERVAEYPGTRPVRWYQFAAPEMRRRLGGVGTPSHERLANVQRLWCGVSVDWITAGDIAIYKKLGRPLGVPAIDPNDPPMFESEAAFLDRLGLFRPGERRRLTPEDFAPQSVLDVLGIDLDEA